MGRFLPPDRSKGDEHTIGGYMAVHARPAAFEGPDGASYSVEIETDDTGEASAPVGAFLLFVRWSSGDPHVSGHVETDFLARGTSETEVRARVGAMTLAEVKTLLDALVRERARPQGRPWWEAMQEPEEE
jgi:hypothetical protein